MLRDEPDTRIQRATFDGTSFQRHAETGLR